MRLHRKMRREGLDLVGIRPPMLCKFLGGGRNGVNPLGRIHWLLSTNKLASRRASLVFQKRIATRHLAPFLRFDRS